MAPPPLCWQPTLLSAFGDTPSFDATFSGDAITAPNGTSTSESAFALSLYDAAGTTPLLTTDPSGAILIINEAGISISNGKNATVTLVGNVVSINGTALTVT